MNIYDMPKPVSLTFWWFTHGRPALLQRCSGCSHWIPFWRIHLPCEAGCPYLGLCKPCIDDAKEADLMQRIRSMSGEAALLCDWPPEDTDNPAEIEILRQREIEDAWTEAENEDAARL